jgi:gliding motility-associated lipoprotein GldH
MNKNPKNNKLKQLFKIIVLASSLFVIACDSNRLIDENKDLPVQGWNYQNKLIFDVPITDTIAQYSLYLNVRISADYLFSNLYLNLHTTLPSMQKQTERKELILADENGKWLGKGLGDLFDYQVPVKEKFRFKENGIYRFELEQNMRNDTLIGVISSGLRIEKVVQ